MVLFLAYRKDGHEAIPFASVESILNYFCHSSPEYTDLLHNRITSPNEVRVILSQGGTVKLTSYLPGFTPREWTLGRAELVY